MLLREKRFDSFPRYFIISNFIRVNILVNSPLFLSEKPNTKISIPFYSFLLVTLGYLRYLFRMRDLVITALEIVLFIKGALLALIYFFLIGAFWFNKSINVFSNV